MKKLCAALLLGTLIVPVGCGSQVDGASCLNPPDDEDVQALVGKSCDTEAMICMSNNGCGGCSVTCKNGAWVSTKPALCSSAGPEC